jgi:hypothetical protein
MFWVLRERRLDATLWWRVANERQSKLDTTVASDEDARLCFEDQKSDFNSKKRRQNIVFLVLR